MGKKASFYLCHHCHSKTTQWSGQCSVCREWNTIEKEEEGKGEVVSLTDHTPALLSHMHGEIDEEYLLSGIDEFDRVMGAGIMVGSLTLVGGEPGIGKSTLLTQVVGNISKNGMENVLYISGEESASQVSARISRLGLHNPHFYLYHQTCWQSMLKEINRLNPICIVIDSIQTCRTKLVDAPAGSPSQIREVTYELMNHIKAKGITAFLVGHITKEGSIAGPKLLEHMVDTVIYFEGDPSHPRRMLRSFKNRFGETNELGLFEMEENGLREVGDPTRFFTLSKFSKGILTPLKEGSRYLIVEVQIHSGVAQGHQVKRVASGVDANRLGMLISLIEGCSPLKFHQQDIYINVVGGLKLDSRHTDLALVAGLMFSDSDQKPKNCLYLGEVGLNGEVYPVPGVTSLLKEAQQRGFNKIVMERESAQAMKIHYPELTILGVERISDLCYKKSF